MRAEQDTVLGNIEPGSPGSFGHRHGDERDGRPVRCRHQVHVNNQKGETTLDTTRTTDNVFSQWGLDSRSLDCQEPLCEDHYPLIRMYWNFIRISPDLPSL